MDNPSDRRILQAIYKRYLHSFKTVSERTDESASKVYIPIDVAAVAKQLNVAKHILFGRLYYHLDQKHRYKDESSGAWTHLFAMQVGGERHCIHFPYLSALVAEKNQEFLRYSISLTLSIVAIVLSIISLTIKAKAG